MNESQPFNRSLHDYVKILERRKGWFLIPSVTMFLSAVMLAFVLPAIYESKGVILIEEQEIPSDFVRSTITSYADQQVQVTSKRVLTTNNILLLIDKFNMYSNASVGDSAASASVPLAQRFRDNVHLELVSADVVDQRSGKAREATIAFTLGFTDPDPAIAQQVAGELAVLFLNENQRDQAEQASSTAQFLAAEAELINAELSSLEQKLADFKVANDGSLPEQYSFNLDVIERSEREFSDLRLREQGLSKRRVELLAKMAQVSPSAPVTLASGDVVMSDADRLQALETEYRRKAAIYRDNHPDVVRLEREISALRAELGVGADVESLRRQLQEQQQHLADLETRYNDNHQEVLSARRVVAQLEQTISKSGGGGARSSSPIANNPAYVILQTELQGIDAELSLLQEKKRELNYKIDQTQTFLKRAPQVEKEYQALLRDYDNATEEYKRIKTNQRDAVTSQNLVQEQKGERFTLIEPPYLPREPVSPNKPAILFMGLVLAVGAGLGAGILRELLDDSIHGVAHLTALMGQAPLVAIPYIDNEFDIARRSRAWFMGIAAIVMSLLLLYVFQHFLLQP